MNKPPKVKLRTTEPLQDYYTDCDGNSWSVARLLDDSKSLPVFDVPLAAIDLSNEIWRECNMAALAFHVKKCRDADINCPILLDWNGFVADGRHRIIQSIVMGRTTIKARRMQWKPDPDKKSEEAA